MYRYDDSSFDKSDFERSNLQFVSFFLSLAVHELRNKVSEFFGTLWVEIILPEFQQQINMFSKFLLLRVTKFTLLM